MSYDSPDFCIDIFPRMKCYLPDILLLLALSVCTRAHSQTRHDTSLTVYFRENSYQPDSAQIQKIDSFFTCYKGVSIRRIEAHTDTIGEASYNRILSQRRSGTIAAYLHKHFGFLKEYPILNYGETRPASAHDDALNRRVEISLQFLPDTHSAVRNEPFQNGQTAIILKKYELDKLYFEPDQAVLENSSLSYIQGIAAILKKYEKAQFEIRGHVNCPLRVKPGSGFMEKMNQLSVDRAKLIYELLIDAGIPADKMTYKGMGNTEMLYPHAENEEEKRKNMRVEIFVIQTSSSQPSRQ